MKKQVLVLAAIIFAFCPLPLLRGRRILAWIIHEPVSVVPNMNVQ